MGLTLWGRLAILYDLFLICLETLIPILHAILAEPTLLLHPKKLKTILFSNVWSFMASSVDERCRELKQSFIRPNAFGCVLDVGAGEFTHPDVDTARCHVPRRVYLLRLRSRITQGTAIHSSISIKKRLPATSPSNRMECSTTKFVRRHTKLGSVNQMSTYWAMVSNKPMRSSDS